MEQIYYTQCPIGYGLGASNGFQIKRITPCYPLDGDFRHLGMRALRAGTAALAPACLRYRRIGGSAEVARLTPRAREYETERGGWGRPGGVFAHGLRLDDAELAAVDAWPAGLLDAPGWRRADPTPSLGRPPEPWALGPGDLPTAPTFEAVAPLAEGLDPSRLARLLTALAVAVREGRTLYLVDAPDRLGRLCMLLSFALPAALRPAITLSTYHDRPEELAGFRLQGTTAAARPNRALLVASGVVADLEAGTFEPPVAPEPWAERLAGWFARRAPADAAEWAATGRIAAGLRAPEATLWSAEWLDALHDLHAWTRPPAVAPARPEGWSRLAALAAWAGEALPGGGWLVRGPSWWIEQAAFSTMPEARAALLAHAGRREAWTDPRNASAWGVVAARWLAGADPTERDRAVGALVRASPSSLRPAFLSSLLRELPAAESSDLLDRLKASPAVDRGLLPPLEMRGAVSRLVVDGDRGPLDEVLGRALALPEAALSAALDALSAEAPGDPGPLAEALADALDGASPPGVDGARRWALGNDRARGWLGPHLRRLFAHAGAVEGWRSLVDRTPADRRSSLAEVALGVAEEPGVAPEAFNWLVENLLLSLAEGRRPVDPSWPNRYLDRVAADLETVERIFGRREGQADVNGWLKGALGRNELSAAHMGRLGAWRQVARARRSGDLRDMEKAMPHVPPVDRGRWLGMLLGQLGSAATLTLELSLKSCGKAWPGAFHAGAPGLAELAAPLVGLLDDRRADPEAWWNRLTLFLGCLDVTYAPGKGFEPDGLAAEILASTTRVAGPGADPWALRSYVFKQDDCGLGSSRRSCVWMRGDACSLIRESIWPTLTIDISRDLANRGAVVAFDDWDDRLDKGRHLARFFEVALNAADGPSLASIVVARAADLSTLLKPLPWWAHSQVEDGRNDLRDAYARSAPMGPIPESTFSKIDGWMRVYRKVATTLTVEGSADLVAVDAPTPTAPPKVQADWSHLSGLGRARWRALAVLAGFRGSGQDASGRWRALVARDEPLLARLDADDRHKLLAWLIRGDDEYHGIPVDRVAAWLHRHGYRDVDRIGRWQAELGRGAVDALRPGLLEFVKELRIELNRTIRDRRAPPTA